MEVFVEGGQGAPLASVSTQEMTVVEGHTVTMSCQASGESRSTCAASTAAAPLSPSSSPPPPPPPLLLLDAR